MITMLHDDGNLRKLVDKLVVVCRELSAHHRDPEAYPVTVASLTSGQEAAAGAALGLRNPIEVKGRVSDAVLVLAQAATCRPASLASALDEVIGARVKRGAERGLGRRRAAEYLSEMRFSGHTQVTLVAGAERNEAGGGGG